MWKGGRRKVIYAALAGNALIALTKLIAGVFTGSSAMLSESVHSFVDTGNQGLMLLGIARSKRAPDEEHPFGYGMEIYFWSFVVAILIFGLGAGISFYEGFLKLIEPHPITHFLVNYIVLALAVVFEGASWLVALREFNTTRGRRGLFNAVRVSKDPTVFTVLFEDSAALLGLLAAAAGLLAAQFLGLDWADAVASMVIGAILALTAFGLAVETKSLLTGEAATPGTLRAIRRTVLAEPEVCRMGALRTVHLGPSDVLATLSVDFRDGLAAPEIEQAVAKLERKVRAAAPSVSHVFIVPRAVSAGGDAPVG